MAKKQGYKKSKEGVLAQGGPGDGEVSLSPVQRRVRALSRKEGCGLSAQENAFQALQKPWIIRMSQMEAADDMRREG